MKKRAKAIMFQGTGSGVGKSIVAPADYYKRSESHWRIVKDAYDSLTVFVQPRLFDLLEKDE